MALKQSKATGGAICEETAEEARANAENDAEVAAILAEAPREDEENSIDNPHQPPKHVVDMIMSWNTEGKRHVPDRIPDRIGVCV